MSRNPVLPTTLPARGLYAKTNTSHRRAKAIPTNLHGKYKRAKRILRTEAMAFTGGQDRGVARKRGGADQKAPSLIYSGDTSSGGILPTTVTSIFYY